MIIYGVPGGNKSLNLGLVHGEASMFELIHSITAENKAQMEANTFFTRWHESPTGNRCENARLVSGSARGRSERSDAEGIVESAVWRKVVRHDWSTAVTLLEDCLIMF